MRFRRLKYRRIVDGIYKVYDGDMYLGVVERLGDRVWRAFPRDGGAAFSDTFTACKAAGFRLRSYARRLSRNG